MASDMASGKGGRRSGSDRRSEFISAYIEFIYKGPERRSENERRCEFDRRKEIRLKEYPRMAHGVVQADTGIGCTDRRSCSTGSRPPLFSGEPAPLFSVLWKLALTSLAVMRSGVRSSSAPPNFT